MCACARKILAIVSVIILLTSVFNCYVRATPTFNVTDTTGYITIENDYYITNISKTFGGIEHLYIKPETTVNIVNTWSYHDCLGMHEIGWINGSEGSYRTQGPISCTEHYDTSVIHYDSSTAIVCSQFRVCETSPYWSVNITEWRTFYADKPWFVVTFTQEFQVDGQFWMQNQICFLYDKDYPSSYRMLTDNGTIVIDDATHYAHYHSSKYLQKYMWVYIHNSTYNSGLGHILIDVYPRGMLARWGDWMGGSYREWQLTLNEWRMGLPANSKQTVTYINYIANNETVIDEFSSDLYKINHKVTQETADYMPIVMNNLSDCKQGGCGKQGSFYTFPLPNLLYGYYFTEGIRSQREIQPCYTNSSGSYKIVASTWTFPSHHWNSTYCNLTMRAEKENMRFDITTEAWKNNDAVKVTLYFEALASLNVTDVYVDFRTYPDDTIWSETELTNDIALTNASNSKVHWMYDYGHAFKNLTAYASRSTTNSDLIYHLLDRATDTEYSSGQSWSLELKVHKFIRTIEDTTFFQASDFLETGSNLVNYNHRYWVLLPFPEVPSEPAFYIDHFGQQYGQIITSAYSSNKLTLRIAGSSGKTSTWEIYCSKGKPKSVEGVSSWSYDSGIKVLTFDLEHSINDVTIRWAGVGVVPQKGWRLEANVHWNPSSYVWDTPVPNLWNAKVSIEGHDARVEIDHATIKLEGKHSPSAPPYAADGAILVVPFNGCDVREEIFKEMPKKQHALIPGEYAISLEIRGKLKSEYGGNLFRGSCIINMVVPEPPPQ